MSLAMYVQHWLAMHGSHLACLYGRERSGMRDWLLRPGGLIH